MWFTITARTPGKAEINIYDEIGSAGITAKDFDIALKGAGRVNTITTRINSPGGSVFEGLAIYNMLKRHPAQVTVYIDGIAASIASLIAMAGDRIIMPENAMMMIHDPSGLVMGTSKDMRGLAEALDRVKQGMVSAYAGRTNLSHERIAELMAAETWLTAAEAVELGFADQIEEPVRFAANFDLSRFEHPPRLPKTIDEFVDEFWAKRRGERVRTNNELAAKELPDPAEVYARWNAPHGGSHGKA